MTCYAWKYILLYIDSDHSFHSASSWFFTLWIYLLFFSASQSVEDTVGSVRHKNCPVSLHPCARDAYLLFQVNHFEDQWMISHWFVSCFRSGRLNLNFPHLKLLPWGGYSAKFYTRRFCPEIQSLNTLLYTPFIYLLFKNGTPFAYLV